MIFRQLDSNSDWTFGKGIANYAQSEAAIDLNIKTTLLSWVGDCFFDRSFGVDWIRLLDTGQQRNLQAALESTILGCTGVVGVTATSAFFAPDTRRLNVKYAVTTVFSRSFASQVSILAGAVGD